MDQTSSNSQTLMARQPIFDRQLKVIAYELLYRSDNDNDSDFLEGDQASSQMLLNFTSISDEGTTKRVPAFIKLTREMLLNQTLPTLLCKQVVAELPGDIEIDKPLLLAVQKLRQDGFKVSIDDFIFDPKYALLLKLVNIVKIDVSKLDEDEVKQQLDALSSYKVTLLAKRIDKLDHLYECVDMGFKLFQGHFLSKPQVVKGKKNVSANSLALMQVVQEVQNPNTTADKLEHLIIKDSVLTFKLLRIVNSAAYALTRKIDSLNQAIVMLGLDQVKKWATLIAMSSNKDKPTELSRALLVRARMCELLAESKGYPDTSNFFLVGIMSEIDALMDMRMDEVLKQIPLNEELKAAIGKRKGTQGEVLKAAFAYERGEWDRLSEFDINDAVYEGAYRHSLSWAQEVMQSMSEDNA
ncbi:EAL and HDOD domain-containing protein [Motiliproteus sp.]|uniref:EAL and HDOD domain-containing protein n=1 Tax=Motiliproteus sp. TaxID=1898955 RepID=UPI003BAB6C81